MNFWFNILEGYTDPGDAKGDSRKETLYLDSRAIVPVEKVFFNVPDYEF